MVNNRTVCVVDVALMPYTQYNYSLTASNSAGSLTTDWTTATTYEAEPSQLAAPRCQTYSDQLDTIRLFWSAPAISNGLSACHIIAQLGLEVGGGYAIPVLHWSARNHLLSVKHIPVCCRARTNHDDEI